MPSTEALSLAEPGGCVRIFLDEGPPMAGLLRQAASQWHVLPPTSRACWRRLTAPEPAGAAAGAAGIPCPASGRTPERA